MDYYWDDLDIGFTDRFGPIVVNRDEVLAFAGRYDPQPFHLSDEAAAQTHFGRLAASGWHTCSMMMGAMVRHWQDTPGWQESSLGAMGIDELRWRRPVFPDDTLHGTSELIEKIESRSRPEMGIVKFRTRLVNQDGEEVLSLVSTAMRKRRPRAQTHTAQRIIGRHSREGGNPASDLSSCHFVGGRWIPAFAGMTVAMAAMPQCRPNNFSMSPCASLIQVGRP